MDASEDSKPGTSASPGELAASRFLNRELSWLDWNRRVLALAEDPAQRLLDHALHAPPSRLDLEAREAGAVVLEDESKSPHA